MSKHKSNLPCCSIAFFGENLIKNISTINVAEVARVDISSVSHLTVLRLFKLLDFNCNATMECGGCLHGHRGDIRASASPL